MKVNYQRMILAVILFFGSMANTSYAAVFSIVPKAGTTLPTTVTAGQTVTAEYTVTNTTGSFHTGNYLKYLPPNVTQITTDATIPNLCGTTFPLAASGSCTLELSVAGAVNGNDPNPQNHLFACLGGCTTCCAGTNFPLNVIETSAQAQTPANLPYLYISGNSTDLNQCPLNANGDSGGTCTALTNSTSPNFVGVYSSAFVTLAGTTYAYVSDIGNSPALLWKCPLTASGTFTACTAQDTGTFNLPVSTTFNTFSGTTYAYVSDLNTNVYQCAVNPGTGGIGSCTALTNAGFGGTRSVTFQTFSGTTYAYVSDGGNNLWQCPINNTTGQFTNGSCTALTNTTSFFQATYSSTFATFSGVTYAYVADHSNKLWQCPMNSTGGISAGCIALTGSPVAFGNTENVSFDTTTSSGTVYAYVSDGSTSIYKCPMNATGGFAGNCAALSNTPQGESYSSATLFYLP